MRSRRSVVAALGAGLAALAGCNSSGDDTTTTSTATRTTTETTTATTTTTTTTTTDDEIEHCDVSWTPDPAWTVDADSVGAPRVAGDRTYAVVDGELRALATEDAGVAWRASVTGNYVYAAADGVVLAADDDGVTAFDAASGDRLWSFVPPGDTGAKTHAVAVHDGTAYVPASQYPTPSTDPDTIYGRLYVFDLASGDRRGVHDITPDDRDWLQPLAALADDTGVYVTIDAGGVLGVSHDGTVEWRRDDDYWYYTPVLAGGVLVQPESRQVTALDPATGETVWTDDRLDMQVAAADGVVYGTSGGSPQTYATVAAIDAATGEAEWTARLDGCGSTIVAGGGVVATGVSCRQNRVDLYDAATGCRYGATDATTDSSPMLAVADGALLAAFQESRHALVSLPLP